MDLAQTILGHLQAVERERARRADDPALQARVTALKAYQQARFRRTYADLLESPRHRAAALFFLDELYGPEDFGRRDEQFARIVAAMTRLFPQEIVGTVVDLAALHALSESLDSAMATCLDSASVSAAAYVQAWQRVSRREDRHQQLRLLLEVGEALDRITRKPLLRHTLKAMRGPARAAGLAELQRFLEQGFDTFREMRGAGEFLATVRQRETHLIDALFDVDVVALATLPRSWAVGGDDDPLGQLP